ncbi:MAG: hypothetical protein ACRDTG_12645 [Pseudonocardiaceae bacterium]
MKPSDGIARALIESNSGSDCFDTTDPFEAEKLSSMIKTQWAGLVQVALSLDSVSVVRNDTVTRLQRVPEMVYIRTPRGAAYSFEVNGRSYIVVDDHLIRLVHRFTRLAQEWGGSPIATAGHFDELMAERLYLRGNYHYSATTAASWLRYGHPNNDFAPQEDVKAAADRAFFQVAFIITHELAHLFLKCLPEDALNVFDEQLRKHVLLGGSLRTLDDLTAVGLVDEFARDDVMRTECMCDALSLASSLSVGGELRDVLRGAVDGLYLLQLLTVADMVADVLSARDGLGHEGLRAQARQYPFRKGSLLFLLGSFIYRMTNWGLGQPAIRIESDVQDSIAKHQNLVRALVDHQPAEAQRQHWDQVMAGQAKADDLDLMAVDAAQDRELAKTMIGFRAPMIDNIKDHPRFLDMSKKNELLQNFMKRNPGYGS